MATPTNMVIPLDRETLNSHVQQRIQERANLGHLYEIEEDDDGGSTAYFTDAAAASIWLVVQDAIREAGWSVTND